MFYTNKAATQNVTHYHLLTALSKAPKHTDFAFLKSEIYCEKMLPKFDTSNVSRIVKVVNNFFVGSYYFLAFLRCFLCVRSGLNRLDLHHCFVMVKKRVFLWFWIGSSFKFCLVVDWFEMLRICFYLWHNIINKVEGVFIGSEKIGVILIKFFFYGFNVITQDPKTFRKDK